MSGGLAGKVSARFLGFPEFNLSWEGTASDFDLSNSHAGLRVVFNERVITPIAKTVIMLLVVQKFKTLSHGVIGSGFPRIGRVRAL